MQPVYGLDPRPGELLAPVDHELAYTRPTGPWGHFDLTAVTGAPPAAGSPDGYVFDAENRQHIVYRGTDNHIH